MTSKREIALTQLKEQSSVKANAKLLAGKKTAGNLVAWTEAFAASGAKPGGKNPPPQNPVE